MERARSSADFVSGATCARAILTDVRALKTISVRVPTYFPAEVAQRYLDEISREIPPKLLLLSAKFEVELADLEGRSAPRKPYQLLGRRDLPPEVRSAAARSMLGYRGAIALREKMKPLGYPNLVNAREAQRRKNAERRRDG
jgi:hypothetical protein